MTHCPFLLQRDHVRVAIKDALNRYTPAVPKECYKVSCTIITWTHVYVHVCFQIVSQSVIFIDLSSM